GRQLRGRVLLGGGREQLPAGRHRHQDDPPREEHALHDRVEGHLGGPRPEQLPRAREDREGPGQRAQLPAVRLAPPRRPVRGPHLPLHRGPELHGPDGARGLDLQDRRGPALLLPAARDRHRGRGQHDRERLLQGSVQGAADGVRGRGPEAAGREPRRQRRVRRLAAGDDAKAAKARASAARERARARGTWPVRRFSLGGQPRDDLRATTTAEERVALMWPLALEAWAVAGRDLPDYERWNAPVRCVPLERLGPALLGRAELIANRRATGRPKDLADTSELERA